MISRSDGNQQMIVGVCGTCCNVCKLYVTKICEGCFQEKTDTNLNALQSTCPIALCAVGRNILFCTRDCPDYPCGLFHYGLPTCDRYLVAASHALSDWDLQISAQAGLQAAKHGADLQLNHRGPDFDIFCLGQFRVFRAGKLITNEEWGQTKGSTQKVKALFAYLLAKGSCGATKDEIIELLWGNQPSSDKVEARLHATLYYLRRALEPDLPPRAESQYVTYRDGRYHLEPPSGLWVDAVAFEEYFNRALLLFEEGQVEDAVRYWRLAESLYKGDYLIDLDKHYTDDYLEDCCHWRRHRLISMYLTILVKLAQYHYQLNEDHLSNQYAQKALAKDRGCEDAYLMIMKLKQRASQYTEVIRQYRLCERALSDLEGRRPSLETTQLYQQCMHTDTVNSI